MSDQTTRADLLLAVYEGIALSIRDGYTVLPGNVAELRLSGGGAKSAFWSQLIADCTGCSVLVPAGSEFGARGAALLAAVAIGWYGSVASAVKATEDNARVYSPDPAKMARCDELYAVYCALQSNLRPAWRKAVGCGYRLLNRLLARYLN